MFAYGYAHNVEFAETKEKGTMIKVVKLVSQQQELHTLPLTFLCSWCGQHRSHGHQFYVWTASLDRLEQSSEEVEENRRRNDTHERVG